MRKLEYRSPSGEKLIPTWGFVILPLIAYAIAVACLVWAYCITIHFQRVQNATALWSSPRVQEYEDIAIWYPVGLSVVLYAGLVAVTARLYLDDRAKIWIVIANCFLSGCMLFAGLYPLYSRTYL
jgi:hypothetical protein